MINDVNKLRSFLSEQLERVSQGDITPSVANSQANIAGKMISSIKMQLEYNKLTGKNIEIEFLGK